MGIQINGQTDSITASDGSLSISGMELSDVTNINASGIGTFNSINATSIVGVSTIGVTTAYVTNINDGPISGTRNRIINGDMRIDQRNVGVAVTPTSDSTYTLDRWKVRYAGSGSGRFSVQKTTTSVSGFPNSAVLTVTTTSAPSGIEFYGFVQDIEGYNTSDLNWGTSNAKTVTYSFWARSSIVGTYCISIRNWGGTMSYVAEFAINTADTFEYKSITIPGPTTGTWETTTNPGLLIQLCLGSGSTREGTPDSWQATNIVATSNQVDWINTSGATFYITGVQLEEGPVATPFERRSYSQEFALCARYYESIDASGSVPVKFGNDGMCISSTVALFQVGGFYPKRAVPTATLSSPGTFAVVNSAGNLIIATGTNIINYGTHNASMTLTVASGLTAGNATQLYSVAGQTPKIQLSSEL